MVFDLRHRGFDSTMRANELSKKIVASNIQLGLNGSATFFAPGNCRFPIDALHNDVTHPFIPRGLHKRHRSAYQLQLHRPVRAIQRQRHLRPNIPAPPRHLPNFVCCSDPRYTSFQTRVRFPTESTSQLLTLQPKKHCLGWERKLCLELCPVQHSHVREVEYKGRCLRWTARSTHRV